MESLIRCCYPTRRSTGRGGLANITDLKTPDIEPPVHVVHPEHERVSTGRGGVGNIRDRSQSKVRDQPEPHVRLPHQEGELVFSSGRGGAGNIRSRSQSKPPGEEKVCLEFSSLFLFFSFSLSSVPSAVRVSSVSYPSPPLPFHSHVTRVPVTRGCTRMSFISLPPFIHQYSNPR